LYAHGSEGSEPGFYRSPTSIAVSPDGKLAYVADATAARLYAIEIGKWRKAAELKLNGEPHAVAVDPAGGTIYVAERLAGTVAVIDPKALKVKGRIHVRKWPVGLAVAKKARRLFVLNQDSHTVSVFDISGKSPRFVKEIRAVREPIYAAVTPDERLTIVTNLLPNGALTDPTVGAVVTVIDNKKLSVASTIKLPPGTTALRGVAVNPNGKWAYVVHGLARFHLPITQLERGWVNTYALSIIDLGNLSRTATLLLDTLTQGAANPFEIACTPDGTTLYVTHAGVHELSVIDIQLVHQLLAGKVPDSLAKLRDGLQPNIWVRLQKDRAVVRELENDLTALYIAGAIKRIPTGGQGPRGLALLPNGSGVLVANYYSGNLAVLDPAGGKPARTISLGAQKAPDAVRRGEMLFHDATLAFQRWHSCASCHPNNGRVDALRWDFLRDGIGNPTDTPSLILVAKTPPYNRRATRKDMAEISFTAVTGGHFIVPNKDQVRDLRAYLESLSPDPNPNLGPDGQLSEAAKRGKALFEGKADCVRCHPPPLYTDLKMHNVGVITPNDPDGRYDTPSLIELHRTAPYLHDGRALTLKEVLTTFNKEDLHGSTSKLTEQELSDLIEFLKSL
jgi:YVTN family beta-propeller protein